MSYMTETEGFLDVVYRKCEEFMRAGGGALSKEQNPGVAYRKPRTSPEQVEQIIALAKSGKLTARQIGEKMGLSRAVVQHVVYHRGISIALERQRT